MEEIKSITYRTIDGKLFESKEEAEQHEMKIRNVKAYKIYAYPDLNEGRRSAEFQGYLLVNSDGYHDMFAEYWCYEKYKNRVAFVMGAFGSNAIMENWSYKSCDVLEVQSEKIIGRVQDKFVPKLW